MQGPGFKLTLRHHFLPDGFIRDTTGWEHKHGNASHRNSTLLDGLASETNSSQLHYECEAPMYSTMIYSKYFGEKKISSLLKKYINDLITVLALNNDMLMFHFDVKRF